MTTAHFREFQLQPTLKGGLIHLNPLQSTDFERLFAVSADPLLWEQHPENTRYRRDVFERFFQGAIESRGAFLVTEAASGVVIGSSRFTGLQQTQSSETKTQVEVGYTFLARSCWGQGHNREMKYLMLEHAFQFVEKVVFYIGEKNFRSRKAIEKIGARLIERIERPQGTSVVYGIDREDWKIIRPMLVENLSEQMPASATAHLR